MSSTTGLRSNIANQFITAVSANVLTDVQYDFWLSSLLQNQVQITGVNIGPGVQTVNINVLPTYEARERVENTNIITDFEETSIISVAITEKPYIAISITTEADQSSIFGAVNNTQETDEAELRGLLRLHSQPASDAILKNLETKVPEKIALDTDIDVANKFDVAATSGVLDIGKEFFTDLDKRYYVDEAPINGGRKVFVCTPDDYEAILNNDEIFKRDIVNEIGQVDENAIFLPTYNWTIKRSNYLYTNTGKKVRIAMTSNSTVLAPGEMSEIYGSTVAISNNNRIPFRLDRYGDFFKGTNAMSLNSFYGVKVYQPKNIYLIENAS